MVNAAKGDPAKPAQAATALEPHCPLNSRTRFDQVKQQLTKVLDSGQLGIFTNGYWTHPDYRLSPELDLVAVSHYLDALTWQRSMIRINTLFGGRTRTSTPWSAGWRRRSAWITRSPSTS